MDRRKIESGIIAGIKRELETNSTVVRFAPNDYFKRLYESNFRVSYSTRTDYYKGIPVETTIATLSK